MSDDDFGIEWIQAPCKGGCGIEIEDEGPVDDDWWCTSCWPGEYRRRLHARIARWKALAKRMRLRWREAIRYANKQYGEWGDESREWDAARKAMLAENQRLKDEADVLRERLAVVVAKMEGKR